MIDSHWCYWIDKSFCHKKRNKEVRNLKKLKNSSIHRPIFLKLAKAKLSQTGLQIHHGVFIQAKTIAIIHQLHILPNPVELSEILMSHHHLRKISNLQVF